MPTNPKSSVNPFNASFPQIFKRNGEVRRHPNAGRFTRAVSIRASKLSPALKEAASITIETPVGLFVLSIGMTELIQSEDGMIEALIINGWEVTASTPNNLEALPFNVQETFMDMGE